MCFLRKGFAKKVIWEMSAHLQDEARQGRQARCWVSVSHFPCYNSQSHPLLEAWLVPKCSAPCLRLVITYPPCLFRCALCESAQPAFMLEKCSLGVLAIKASINYRADKRQRFTGSQDLHGSLFWRGGEESLWKGGPLLKVPFSCPFERSAFQNFLQIVLSK